MARWCKECNVPLPDFWFPSHSKVDSISAFENLKKLAGEKYVLFPMGRLDIPLEHDKKTPLPDSTEQPSIDSAASTRGKQIALAGYQPLHEIKRRFVRFFYSGNTFDSRREAARQFFIALPIEERYVLVPSLDDDAKDSSLPVDKAVRTLTAALREFDNKKDTPWLEDFSL